MAAQQAPDRLLTPGEVAALAFVDPKTVSRWARAGKISSERTPGGHRRFRSSDVEALLIQARSRDDSPRSSANPSPDTRRVDGADIRAVRGIQSAAADAVVAEALAIAMEARAEAAAGAVLDIEMAVAAAAETAKLAAIEAARARAIAAAEAARVVAHEAVIAAADIRSRATAQAERLAEAAVQARTLVSAQRTDEQTTFAAERMAATVQDAAEAASTDTAQAAARVASAVTDAAAHVAEMVADFDLSVERATDATAQALREATLGTARHVAQENRMAMRTTPTVDLRRVLAAADAASPVGAIDAVTAELHHAFGAETVSFLISDASGRALVPIAHVSDPTPCAGARRGEQEPATTLPLDSGPAEQAMRTQTVQVLAPDDDWGTAERWRVMAPVAEHGDVLGLLEMTFTEEPSAETVRALAYVGHLLSYIVIANRRHTDLFEWGQRTRPFTLSAEIQQRLLPLSRTVETTQFTLAAWVEPAATIGGDTYDYSLAEDVLHFSLTDAMGHGVGAALTATMCLASLRGSRRVGATLVEGVRAANAAMCAHANSGNDNDFATGLIGRVDLASGVLEIINAGHDLPFLLRSGVVTPLDVPPGLPLGIFAGATHTRARIALTPGDRIILVTDGMLERITGREELSATVESSQGIHPREAVRAIADEVLETTGRALTDDATILCLDWHGGAP